MRLPVLLAMLLFIALTGRNLAADEPLPGTAALTRTGDISAQLVDAVSAFLDQQYAALPELRAKTVTATDDESRTAQRAKLAQRLGVRDARVPFNAPELMATTEAPALVAEGLGYRVFAVRWPVLASPDPSWTAQVSVTGEGLLFVPSDGEPVADIVALPDADQTPEQIAGLAEGVDAKSQFARHLAESGCRVLVPVLISREYKPRGGRASMTNREYIYRSAYVLGRHPIGYELQKVFAAVDWFAREAEAAQRPAKIGVFGYGEGGMLAFYAGALDPRIGAVGVSGYLDDRRALWRQPIDRNVFGLLPEFGDAELMALIAPRNIIMELGRGPELTLAGGGGAPGVLQSPDYSEGPARKEFQRGVDLIKPFQPRVLPPQGHTLQSIRPAETDKSKPHFGTRTATDFLLQKLGHPTDLFFDTALPTVHRSTDPAARQQRQLDELDRHNQLLLRVSQDVRKARFWDKLDFSSPEAYAKSVAPFREEFRDDVIGRFDLPLLPLNAQSRKVYDEEKWTGYEVTLDVFPGVFAYGVLCLPKDLKTDGSERRPVVVCQHGLEGRPQDLVQGDNRAYHDYAARLAERGFITFAPQNLYLGEDRFRVLQRKANPLGKTLFSIIVPQHQQIVAWLKSQPYVDGERIAFYGLSYGGKSAMRIPPLVPEYCLSICSADFNEWVDKNASTLGPYSYVWTHEYEIFEWDLGSTFNYAEMAALIAPRPFMVERGHFDAVGTDANVAYEFAKVRRLYQAHLRLPGEACQIEWFVGPHEINGRGTFDFLHQHLKWPPPK